VTGSLAIALAPAANGAHILRVHDVAETVQALRMAEALAAGFEET
jgi:dihydropteroate synthase